MVTSVSQLTGFCMYVWYSFLRHYVHTGGMYVYYQGPKGVYVYTYDIPYVNARDRLTGRKCLDYVGVEGQAQV